MLVKVSELRVGDVLKCGQTITYISAPVRSGILSSHLWVVASQLVGGLRGTVSCVPGEYEMELLQRKTT